MEGRGIDTRYERSKLEYNPIIKYVRSNVTHYPAAARRGISEEVANASRHLVTDMADEYRSIQADLNALIEATEDRLKNVTVSVRDENEETVKQIKEAIDKTTITFDDYKRLYNLEQLKPGESLVLDHYKEVNNGPEGNFALSVWEELGSMRDEIELYSGSINNIVQVHLQDEEVGDEETKVISKDKAKKRETETYSEWAEIEAQIEDINDEIDSFEGEGLTIDEARRIKELSKKREKLKKKLERYKSNPLPSVAKVHKDKINKTREIIKEYQSVMSESVLDSIEGSIECFVRNLVDNYEVDTTLAQRRIDEIVSKLRKVRAAIAWVATPLTMEGNKLLNVVRNLLSGPLTSLTNKLLELVSDAKKRISQPVYEFMDNMSSNKRYECLPLDIIADMIMDGIEDIENRFKEVILEAYKLASQGHSTRKQNLRNVTKLKKVQDVVVIIDEVIRLLESVSLDFDGYIDEEEMASNITDKIVGLEERLAKGFTIKKSNSEDSDTEIKNPVQVESSTSIQRTEKE